MRQVTVIAAMGAAVRGPCSLKLSKEQAERRAHLLGPAGRRGTYFLDGGREVQFKAGESFGIDSPERLSRVLFSWKEEPTEAGTDAAAQDAPAADDATAKPAAQ